MGHLTQITGRRRIVITGPVQSGKSTLAWELTRQLKKRDIPMAGFIARGLWKKNQRWGFDLFNLKTEQSIPLARRKKNTPCGFTASHPGMPYTFFPEGTAAGMDALCPDQCRDAKIIVVDELGRLEAEQKGWSSCIPPLMALYGPLHIWVIRTTLVESICRLWPFAQTDVVHVHDADALKTLLDLCNSEI